MPRDGVVVKMSALVALGSEARAGLGAEAGLSRVSDRLELGVGVLLMGLWASESGFHDLYESSGGRGPRENRDLVLLPRLKLSAPLESTAFLRVHASGGFGHAWLRAEGGDAGLAEGERGIWSYAAGLGLSAGVFHANADLFGYLSSAERFEWSFLSTTHHPGRTRGAPGLVVSLALVLPLALSGSHASAPRADEPHAETPRPPSAWRRPRR